MISRVAILLLVATTTLDCRATKINESRFVSADRKKKEINLQEVFNLRDEEINRFKHIMNGSRGIPSPSLDPLSALGIESRNDAELRH